MASNGLGDAIKHVEQDLVVQRQREQQKPVERRTMELRWWWGADNLQMPRLQQKWQVAEFFDGHWKAREEWRDVPEVRE